MSKYRCSAKVKGSVRVCVGFRYSLIEIKRRERLPSARHFLDLSCSSVDEEFDTSDEAAVIGGEEDHGLGDLVRGAESAHRDEAVDVREALLANVTAAEEFAKALGVDGARAYDVDADVAGFEVRRPGACEGADRGLGCRVDTVGGKAFAADNGAIENDRCTVGKERQRLLHGEEEAFDVRIEDAVEVLLVDRAKGSIFGDAGVSEDNVEFAFLFLDLGEEAVDIFEIGYVSLDSGDVRANFFDGFVQSGLVAAGDEDVGAFTDETFGGGEADAAGAACDQCDFAAELAHFLSPILNSCRTE
jgi:hypothetical protein